MRLAKCTLQAAMRGLDDAVDQPPARAQAKSADGVQVADQQLRVALLVRLRRRLHAQKQAWLSFDACALLCVATAPMSIQLAHLALGDRRLASEVEMLHDARARLAFVARQRHQILHRGLCRHEAVAHCGLRQLGQQIHERQTPADPAVRAAQALA